MFTLLSTLISFLAGGLPKVLEIYQDKQDKKHEILLAQMQVEREIQLRNAGFEAQAKVEEIHTEQMMIEADTANQQFKLQEREALYAHDVAIGQGASTWVVNARAMVRPAITYGLFLLFAFVEVASFVYACFHDVPFVDMVNNLWDENTQTIWASVVSFWFGTQAFKNGK